MIEQGYLYKTTYKPTGLMYFGSRKLKAGLCPETEAYRGTPCGSNKMKELFETCHESAFVKEVLTVGEYSEIVEFEELLIKEAWEKFGKESEGGLVCNLNVAGKIIYTKEVRAKMSKSNTGKKQSSATKAKLRKIRLGRTPGNKGVPMTPEQRRKMSIAKTGKPAKNRKAVVNIATGQTWPSLTAAAEAEGVSLSFVSVSIKNQTGRWKLREEE